MSWLLCLTSKLILCNDRGKSSQPTLLSLLHAPIGLAHGHFSFILVFIRSIEQQSLQNIRQSVPLVIKLNTCVVFIQNYIWHANLSSGLLQRLYKLYSQPKKVLPESSRCFQMKYSAIEQAKYWCMERVVVER